MIKKNISLTLFLMFLGVNCAYAIPSNLLTNAGFETGDYSGWSLGGNSPSYGVASDNTLLSGAVSPFSPNYQNVRSGNYAGNALVCCTVTSAGQVPERFFLSQTLSVVENSTYDIGFWLGVDANSGFGVDYNDQELQIFVDGIGLLSSPRVIVTPGSSPSSFLNIESSFNSGNQSSLEILFSLTGSGSSNVNISFDDFYVNGPSVVSSVPEPPTLILLVPALFIVLLSVYLRSKDYNLS